MSGMPGRTPQLSAALDLKVPRIVGSSRNYEAKCKREYNSNTHLYFIHSVSVCSDEATFLTADDLSVYLWDLERVDSSFRALDIRPAIPDENDVRSPVLQPLHVDWRIWSKYLWSMHWFLLRFCALLLQASSWHHFCTVIGSCSQCLHGHFHSHSNSWANRPQHEWFGGFSCSQTVTRLPGVSHGATFFGCPPFQEPP